MRIKYLFITLTLLLAPAISCGENPESIREPLIHVIISDRIQGIMLRLNALVNERGLTALQIMDLRVQHLKELISTIDELVDAAEDLDEAIPGIRMSQENKITFEALAGKLQEEGKHLKSLAEQTNYAGMEPAYQKLRSTCEACHQLFRF